MTDFVGSGGIGLLGGGERSDIADWVPDHLEGATAVFSAAFGRFAVPNSGTELLVNNGFDNDFSNWNDHSTAPGASSWNNGRVVLSSGSNSGEWSRVKQSFATIVGRVYKVSLTNAPDSADEISLLTADRSDPIARATPGETATGYFVALGASTEVSIRNFRVSTTSYCERVSVREILPGSLQSAAASEFFEGYSRPTLSWPTGPDGLPYEVAADSPAFIYHTGVRELECDSGGTRLNDSRPQGHGGGYDGINLSAVGLFEAPMRVASQGATWNRFEQPIVWTAGTSICLTAQIAPGTSGRVRVVFKYSDPNTHNRIRGQIGNLENIETDWGNIDSFEEFLLPNGHTLIHVKFTPDQSGNGTVGIGPDTDAVGEDVVVYAMQIRDQGFGWIFGDQTQQATQASTTCALPDLINAFANSPAVTLVVWGHSKFDELARIIGSETYAAPALVPTDYPDRVRTYNDPGSLTAIGNSGLPGKFAVAVAYDVNGRSLCYNGGEVASDNEGMGDISKLYLGSAGIAGKHLNAGFGGFAVFDRRLTDADLSTIVLEAMH